MTYAEYKAAALLTADQLHKILWSIMPGNKAGRPTKIKRNAVDVLDKMRKKSAMGMIEFFTCLKISNRTSPEYRARLRCSQTHPFHGRLRKVLCCPYALVIT
jgi:hypothetical protein